jgi:hypothetical protein
MNFTMRQQLSLEPSLSISLDDRLELSPAQVMLLETGPQLFADLDSQDDRQHASSQYFLYNGIVVAVEKAYKAQPKPTEPLAIRNAKGVLRHLDGELTRCIDNKPYAMYAINSQFTAVHGFVTTAKNGLADNYS